ncbi:unnamed protein product [Closterium sp. Naga37s-1]|nr:unnamed protein product [Closterium sp. Naga37s-1]
MGSLELPTRALGAQRPGTNAKLALFTPANYYVPRSKTPPAGGGSAPGGLSYFLPHSLVFRAIAAVLLVILAVSLELLLLNFFQSRAATSPLKALFPQRPASPAPPISASPATPQLAPMLAIDPPLLRGAESARAAVGGGGVPFAPAFAAWTMIPRIVPLVSPTFEPPPLAVVWAGSKCSDDCHNRGTSPAAAVPAGGGIAGWEWYRVTASGSGEETGRERVGKGELEGGEHLRPPGDCPERCSGVGTCYSDGCRCPWFRTGKACEAVAKGVGCVNACSGRGECVEGTCRCQYWTFGVDCSLFLDTMGSVRHVNLLFPPFRWAHHLPAPSLAHIATSRPLIYVYDLPSPATTWPLRLSSRSPHIEPLLFLERLLNSGHRSAKPDTADLFYVPLFFRNDKALDANLLASTITYIRTTWPYWDRRNGSDHIFLLPPPLSRCTLGDSGSTEPLLSRSIVLSTCGYTHSLASPSSRDPASAPSTPLPLLPCFQRGRDVVIPPVLRLKDYHAIPFLSELVREESSAANVSPAGSNSGSGDSADSLSVSSPRPTVLFARFAASDLQQNRTGLSSSVTKRFLELFESRAAELKWQIEVQESAKVRVSDLLNATFCLSTAARGQHSSSVASVLAGCIPVVVESHTVLPLDHPHGLNWTAFSLRVPLSNLPDLPTLLSSLSPQVVAAMQRELRGAWPKLVWASSQFNPLPRGLAVSRAFHRAGLLLADGDVFSSFRDVGAGVGKDGKGRRAVVSDGPSPWAGPEECESMCSGRGVCRKESKVCAWYDNGRACETRGDLPFDCFNGCSGQGECRRGVCVCQRGYFGLDCSMFIDAQGTTRILRLQPFLWSTAVPPPSPSPSSSSPLRPLIYVYDLPPHFNTWQFAQTRYIDWREQVFFLERLLRSPHRTPDPAQADFFYVPLMFRARLMKANTLAWAVSYLRSTWPFWDRSNGSDHVFVTNDDWGNCDISVSGERDSFLANSITLTLWGLTQNMNLEDAPNRCFKAGQDVAIPPMMVPDVYKYVVEVKEMVKREMRRRGKTGEVVEAGVAEGTGKDAEIGAQEEAEEERNSLEAVLSGANRTTLLYFKGWPADKATSHGSYHWSFGVRQEMFKLFGGRFNETGVLLESTEGFVQGYLVEMQRAVFCLAPSGWGWGMRTTQALMLGCIPVIIQPHVVQPLEGDGTDWSQLGVVPFEGDGTDWSRLAVILSKADIPHLPRILSSIPDLERRAKRRAMLDEWVKFVWASTQLNPFGFLPKGLQDEMAVRLEKGDVFATACYTHGTCNEELKRCDCPPGLTGKDCSDRAMPSCHVAPGYWTPCGVLSSCECALECERAGVPPFPLCLDESEGGEGRGGEGGEQGGAEEGVGRGEGEGSAVGAEAKEEGSQGEEEAEDPALSQPAWQRAGWQGLSSLLKKPVVWMATDGAGGETGARERVGEGVTGQQSNGVGAAGAATASNPFPLLQSLLLPSECPGNCSGLGVCLASKQCMCPPMLSGPSCARLPSLLPFTCLNECHSRGVCVHGFCICNPGYFGIDCSLSKPGSIDRTRIVAAPPFSWPEGLSLPTPAPAASPLIYIYDLPPHVTSWSLLLGTPPSSPLLSSFSAPSHSPGPKAGEGGDDGGRVGGRGGGEGGGEWEGGAEGVEAVLFLERLLRSPYRTADPYAAHFFLIPVLPWAGEASILRAVYYVRRLWPFWSNSNGANHLILTTITAAPAHSPLCSLTPDKSRHPLLARCSLLAIPVADTTFPSSPLIQVSPETDRSAAAAASPTSSSGNESSSLPCFLPSQDILLPPALPPIALTRSLFTLRPPAKQPTRGTLLLFSDWGVGEWTGENVGGGGGGEGSGERGDGGVKEVRDRVMGGLKEEAHKGKVIVLSQDRENQNQNRDGSSSSNKSGSGNGDGGRSGSFGLEAVVDAALGSVFCLVLPGWTHTMEAPLFVLHGCIPVFIQRDEEGEVSPPQSLQNSTVLDWSDLSLTLPASQAHVLVTSLLKTPHEDIDRRREEMGKIWSKLVWTSPSFNPLVLLPGDDQRRLTPLLAADDVFQAIVAKLQKRLEK